MDFKKITMQDFNNVISFYNDVIENTKDIEKYAKWKKDQHPTCELIQSFIQKEEMYVLLENNKIIASLAISLKQENDYHDINWKIDVKDDEVCVIHILAVSPQKQNCGIGKKLIDFAIEKAKNCNKKTLRLDCLECNKPSQKMYEQKGFVYCGKKNMYAKNTGFIDFYFYDFVL